MKLMNLVAPIGSAVALLSSSTIALAQTYNIEPGTGYADNPSSLISFILRLVLAVGALLVFGFLIMGGIQWITSGGDKGKTESARNTITAAIIGLIILAASWAILNLVLGFLGLGSLNGALDSVGTINTPGK